MSVTKLGMALPELDDAVPRGRRPSRACDETASPFSNLQIISGHPSNPSGGSTNFRGRGRRRSASSHFGTPLNTSDTEEEVRAISASASLKARKYRLRVQREGTERRRSQSPSRSRSNALNTSPKRRRQRTATRSRSHIRDSEAKPGDAKSEDVKMGKEETQVEEYQPQK